jgi:hypothetical protein
MDGAKVIGNRMAQSGNSTYFAPTLRQVTNRSLIFQTKSATSKYTRSKRGYTLNTNVTSLQLMFAAWYVAGYGSTLADYQEHGTGGDVTYAASVEYPSGTFTQVLFSGVSTGIATDGNEVIGIATVNIPTGAIFWVHTRADCPAGGAVTCGNGNLSADPGPVFDSLHWGDKTDTSATSLSDITMTGVGYSNNAGSIGTAFGPILILGMSNAPAVINYGTSISHGEPGVQTYPIATSGEICMSLDRDGIPYCNAGIRGDTVAKFLLSHTKRVAMSQYFQYVVFGGPTNDIGVSGRTAIAVDADCQTQYALFPGKRLIQSTMCPYASGATGQTVNSSINTQRVALKNLVMTGSQPLLYGKWDIGSSLETTPDAGLWKTTPAAMTSGGVHPNTLGYQTIMNSGEIDTSIIKPY